MFRGDRNYSRFEGSSVDFAFLAGGATLDILLNVLFHFRPPEVPLGEGVGVGNSWVSSSRIIVIKLIYPPLQIIVTGNDGPGSLPPVSICNATARRSSTMCTTGLETVRECVRIRNSVR